VVDGPPWLAASLMAHRDPAEAIDAFIRNERIAAMNDMIIRKSQSRIGVDPADRRGARAGRLSAHPRCAVAGGGLKHTGGPVFKEAAGFDVETVNSRESFRRGGERPRARGFLSFDTPAGLETKSFRFVY